MKLNERGKQYSRKVQLWEWIRTSISDMEPAETKQKYIKISR